jgi:hypothetical protein
LYYILPKKIPKKGMRVKREKREKGLKSSPEYADYPKTETVAAVAAAEEVVTVSGTAESRKAAPGTAPKYTISVICQEFIYTI